MNNEVGNTFSGDRQERAGTVISFVYACGFMKSDVSSAATES